MVTLVENDLYTESDLPKTAPEKCPMVETEGLYEDVKDARRGLSNSSGKTGRMEKVECSDASDDDGTFIVDNVTYGDGPPNDNGKVKV